MTAVEPLASGVMTPEATLSDLGVANRDLGFGSKILGVAVRIEPLDDNPLAAAAARQNDLRAERS